MTEIDEGVAVHFANESVDLQSRGGRLSADIQAVVATDYIRNLREETLKGLYGRLKQGLYPFGAPLGYLDAGGGKIKPIDPVRGPLVAEAFELYATGRYTLDTLLIELRRRGLKTRAGGDMHLTGLSRMLNNPFHAGIIRIDTTGETFSGKHEPLIPMSLFKQVQTRLAGRTRVEGWTHDFTFRGLFRCSLCNRVLTGESQKGHVYYRCHTRTCPTRGFREEVLEGALLKTWPPIAATDEDVRRLKELLEYVDSRALPDDAPRLNHVQMQLGAVNARMTRLVDALVDGNLDKEMFEARKRELLEEQKQLEDALRPRDNARTADPKQVVVDVFELVLSAQRRYELADPPTRRELVMRLSSNRTVAEKNVFVEPHPVLRVLAKRRILSRGDLIGI